MLVDRRERRQLPDCGTQPLLPSLSQRLLEERYRSETAKEQRRSDTTAESRLECTVGIEFEGRGEKEGRCVACRDFRLLASLPSHPQEQLGCKR